MGEYDKGYYGIFMLDIYFNLNIKKNDLIENFILSVKWYHSYHFWSFIGKIHSKDLKEVSLNNLHESFLDVTWKVITLLQ